MKSGADGSCANLTFLAAICPASDSKIKGLFARLKIIANSCFSRHLSHFEMQQTDEAKISDADMEPIPNRNITGQKFVSATALGKINRRQRKKAIPVLFTID